MSRRTSMILCLIGVAALGIVPSAAYVPLPRMVISKPRASTMPADPPSAEFRAAVAALSSEDFKVRAAAQRLLEQEPDEYHAWIADALAGTKDNETKARLRKVLGLMEDELAIDPPPLTLHVEQANPVVVYQAIADQMGLSTMGPESAGKITLDLMKRPFGEVYGRLCQMGLELTPIAGNGTIKRLPQIYKYTVYKGFTHFYSSVVTTKSVDAKDSAYEQTLLTIGVMADPRIHVLYSSRPQILKIVDNAGNILLDRKSSGVAGEVNEEGKGVWLGYVGFAIPEKPGTRLAKVTGKTEFVVGVGQDSNTIKEIAKHSGEAFTVGDEKFVLNKFDIDADGMGTINVSRAKGVSPICFEMELADAAGNVVFRDSAVYRVEKQFAIAVKGPLNMKITLPKRAINIEVPFELKDIAYPH